MMKIVRTYFKLAFVLLSLVPSNLDTDSIKPTRTVILMALLITQLAVNRAH